MNSLFLSLFLVIFLLCITCGRVFKKQFYVDTQKSDTFAILPILCIGISLLMLNAFEFSFSILIILCLSILVFFINLRRFYNLCLGLSKDSYNLTIKIFSGIALFLILSFLILIIIFSPVYIDSSKSETVLFYGSHKTGFFQKSSLFEKTSARLDIYDSPVENAAKVIYIPDIYIDTDKTDGTLTFLSDKGYDIYAFNFYDKNFNYFENFKDSKSFQKFFLRYEYLKNPSNIQTNMELIQHKLITDYTSALSIMESYDKGPVYILAEGNSVIAAEIIKNKFPDVVQSVYNINQIDKIDEYIDGFGNFQQLMPLESAVLFNSVNKSLDNCKKIAFYADEFYKSENLTSKNNNLKEN